MTKPLFVAVILSVWCGYDVVSTLMATMDWRAYWWNLYHDPCFLDPVFMAAKAQAVVDGCNAVSALELTRHRAHRDVNDTAAVAALYGACFPDAVSAYEQHQQVS